MPADRRRRAGKPGALLTQQRKNTIAAVSAPGAWPRGVRSLRSIIWSARRPSKPATARWVHLAPQPAPIAASRPMLAPPRSRCTAGPQPPRIAQQANELRPVPRPMPRRGRMMRSEQSVECIPSAQRRGSAASPQSASAPAVLVGQQQKKTLRERHVAGALRPARSAQHAAKQSAAAKQQSQHHQTRNTIPFSPTPACTHCR